MLSILLEREGLRKAFDLANEFGELATKGPVFERVASHCFRRRAWGSNQIRSAGKTSPSSTTMPSVSSTARAMPPDERGTVCSATRATQRHRWEASRSSSPIVMQLPAIVWLRGHVDSRQPCDGSQRSVSVDR